MEALLVASSVLLAAQYQRNPNQFRFVAPSFLQKQGSTADTGDDNVDQLGCDLTQEYTNPADPCYDKDNRRQQPVTDNGEATQLGPGEYNFYPDDFFNNRLPHRNAGPLPFMPSQPTIAGARPRPLNAGVVNPVQVDMMDDIRTGNNRLPASTALQSAYRPSWVRNTMENAQPLKQEREQAWTHEIPREAQIHTLPTVNQRLASHSIATLNQFGQAGLPFDEQIRDIPDGLDPDPLRRKPTARFNTYALGEDLTRSMADQGRVPGLAQGQFVEGLKFRQNAWEVMPDRDIQLQPSSAPMPLSGSGVRSGGRGAQLGSFLGAPVQPGSSTRRGIEWDSGPTGNKSIVPSLPIRPQDDPLDKRFVTEDIDPTKAQFGTSRKPEIPQGPTTLLGNKGAWKFSFDMKSLFDMPSNAKNIAQTAPEKIVNLAENNRQNIKTSTAAARRQVDLTFNGAHATGRRVAIELSDAPIKRNALNDLPSYDNDKILEQGGVLRLPMAAPKTDTPDYAQATIGTMRNGREFRRR